MAAAASGGSGSSLYSSSPPAPERASRSGSGVGPGMEFPGELGECRGGAERRAGDLGRVGGSCGGCARGPTVRGGAVRCGPAGREAGARRRANGVRLLEIRVH